MDANVIDTLRFADRLKNAGFDLRKAVGPGSGVETHKGPLPQTLVKSAMDAPSHPVD